MTDDPAALYVDALRLGHRLVLLIAARHPRVRVLAERVAARVGAEIDRVCPPPPVADIRSARRSRPN